NLTGIYFVVGELVPKRLELLRELVPAMTRVAVFVNPANPARAESQIKEAESAGRQMGLRIQIFTTLARERPDALLVSPDPLYVVRRERAASGISPGTKNFFCINVFHTKATLPLYGQNHFWTGFCQRGHEQFSESKSPPYRGVASAARTSKL